MEGCEKLACGLGDDAGMRRTHGHADCRLQRGVPRLQLTEKNDCCRRFCWTAFTTRFFRGISPGYGCNVAIEVRGPLATNDRVNVAHGRAERAGAVTPIIFAF
jgi:hypothetical protein